MLKFHPSENETLLLRALLGPSVTRIKSSQRVVPKAIGDECFGFEQNNINLSDLGFINGAAEIEQEWNSLNRDDMCLNSISEWLTIIQVAYGICSKFLSLTPLWEILARLVDSIKTLRDKEGKSIQGSQRKVNELRKNLRKIERQLSQGDLFSKRWFGYAQELMTSVMAWNSELALINEMAGLGYHCELPRSGSDMRVTNHKTTLVETKYKWKPKGYLSSDVPPSSLLPSLCKSVQDNIERAFEDQAADVALVNVSHIQEGALLPLVCQTDLEKAFKEALQMNGCGKKAVILYAQMYGSKSVVAHCMEREKVKYFAEKV